MEIHYTWKTRFFSTDYQIYRNDIQVGAITNKAFSRSATSDLNGKKLVLEIKGLFRRESRIINPVDNSVVMEIIISNWKSNAVMNYNGRDYEWKHNNFWNTKWSINNQAGPLVKYHSYSMRGEIVSYTDDDILILTGLLIKNYFKQRSAAVAASA